MSPVGGSRHYAGKGLGEIGLWGCPSCGEDNTGPITQGCVHCGAGRPKATVAGPPPPEREQPLLHDDVGVGQGDVADYWAEKHPEVTVAEAYRAGYLAGVRAARAAQAPSKPPEPSQQLKDHIDVTKMNHTIIAALELLRRQVLIDAQDERADWLTIEDVDLLIESLQQALEETHA